jgi:hypothetical protein
MNTVAQKLGNPGSVGLIKATGIFVSRLGESNR